MTAATSPPAAVRPAVRLATPERSLQARKIVRHHAALCAAASMIPLPVAGSIAVTGVQLDMLGDISRLYGVPFSHDAGRALVAAAAGGVLNYYLAQNPITRAVRDFLNATVPWIALPLRLFTGPLLMAGYTTLLGQSFIRHSERGGSYLDFDWSAFRRELTAKLGIGSTPPSPVIDILATTVPTNGVRP